MKVFKITGNIILIGLTAFLFYLAYQKYHLPFNEEGIFTAPNGHIYRRADAFNNLIVGIICLVFILVWNVLLRKLKKE